MRSKIDSNTTPVDDLQAADSCPFELTVMTSTGGNATKRIIDDGTGRPVKDAKHSLAIWSGRAEQRTVDGLRGLAALLGELKPNAALVHGVHGQTTATVKVVAREKFQSQPGTITRTRDFFDYPDGVQLIMFDVDPADEAPVNVDNAADLMCRLIDVIPELAGAGHLVTVSTSSAIRDRASGDWLRPPDGMHIYLLVAGDVARFRQTAEVRLWLAGTGFIKMTAPNSQTGVSSALARCLIDLSVFSPERLDYVVGAKIAKALPFYQDRPPPALVSGHVVDLDAIAQPTDAERAEMAKMQADAKATVHGAIETQVEAVVFKQLPNLKPAERQREVQARIERAERGELAHNHLLYLDDGQTITAGALIADHDMKTLADPADPSYGRGRAKIYWNDGRGVRISSKAHGLDTIYTIAAAPINGDDAINAMAALSSIEYDRKRKNAAAKLGITLATLDREVKAARKQQQQHGEPTEPAPVAAWKATLTDTGNARRFADMYRDRVRFVREFGRWYVFNGHYWERDDSGEIMRLCRAVAYSIYGEAAEHKDNPDAADAFAFHAQCSLSHRSLKDMVALAMSEAGMTTSQAALDADPLLLGVQNGVIDLRTGEHRPGRAEDLITKVSPIAFDPDATAPRWSLFVREVMADDDAMVAYLQRLAGYLLTGSTQEQSFYIQYGTGANGKSTFLDTLQALLGEDYASTAAPDLMLARKGDRHPTELADLKGARLVVSVETGEGRSLNENLVKQMTGGDRLKARFMRQDFFEFTPEFKLILATNHRPSIKGTDHAIWRRVHMIPFVVTFSADQRDDELPATLQAELPGILNWCLEGCAEWQRIGLQPPDAVTSATDDYRKESDVLAAFLDECCITLPGCYAVKADLYQRYTSWCDDNGEYPLKQRDLSRRLQDRGFREGGSRKGGRQWEGLGLLRAGDDGNAPNDGSRTSPTSPIGDVTSLERHLTEIM